MRAENGTRTRDPNLGKVVLYQLSYFRIRKSEEEETRTPTSQLTLPPQSSASTNSATSPTFTCYFMYVPRTGLEPARLAAHAPETCASTNSATWAYTFQENNTGIFPVVSIRRAENGTRTRDPNLGKVVLYQLSYFRIKRLQFFNCGCKSNIFFLNTQLFLTYF